MKKLKNDSEQQHLKRKMVFHKKVDATRVADKDPFSKMISDRNNISFQQKFSAHLQNNYLAQVPVYKTVQDFKLEEADVKKALEKFKNQGKLKDVNTGTMMYAKKREMQIEDLEEVDLKIFQKEFKFK